jgi:PEP-CTERM motif
MQKSLWIIIAALFLSIVAAPASYGDSLYVYQFSFPMDSISWTTVPIPLITVNTSIPLTDLAFGSCGAGCSIAAFGIYPTAVTINGTSVPGDLIYTAGSNGIQLFDSSFSVAQFTTPGTYSAEGRVTLSITASNATTPEPGTVELTLAGVGFVLGMLRKRIALCLPRSS